MGQDRITGETIWTVPNALSMLRLAGVPVFLWLLLGPERDGVALTLLAASAVTDWLDGKLARLLDQSSRLGAMLDPAVDRLYIGATLLAFGLRDIVPWWLIGLLVGRDLAVGCCLPVLARRGYAPFPVTYLGKAATFALLYALPLLLLAEQDTAVSEVVRPVSYAFTIWGTGLYLWSALLYLAQFVLALRAPVTPGGVLAGAGPGPAHRGTTDHDGDDDREHDS